LEEDLTLTAAAAALTTAPTAVPSAVGMVPGMVDKPGLAVGMPEVLLLLACTWQESTLEACT